MIAVKQQKWHKSGGVSYLSYTNNLPGNQEQQSK